MFKRNRTLVNLDARLASIEKELAVSNNSGQRAVSSMYDIREEIRSQASAIRDHIRNELDKDRKLEPRYGLLMFEGHMPGDDNYPRVLQMHVNIDKNGYCQMNGSDLPPGINWRVASLTFRNL